MDEKEVSAREKRRKRRIRNQIIAYVSLVAVIGAVAAGIFLGVRKVVQVADDRKQQEELQQQLEELQAQAESEAVEAETVIAETEEYTSDDLLEEVVSYAMEGMKTEDKVAQLFFITPEALTGVGTVTQGGDKTKEALARYPVGGILYFDKNIKSAQQFADMTAFTTDASKYVPFLGVDEEGGSVSRIADSAISAEKTPSAGEIGAGGDPQAAYQAGNTIGSYLISNGINFDFAPVADVVTDADHNTLKDRSFGTDAAYVGAMAACMTQGLQDAGVSACLKHFPGLGGVSEDTHDTKAVSQRTLEEMRAQEFVAFQAGIDAGADCVMVSHLSVPSVSGDETPSSLSKAMVTDVLRGELGYDGLVITDALNMKAITAEYASGEAAVMAVNAGVDMLLMPDNFTEAYQAVLDAVNDGTISEARLDESVQRIFKVKYKSSVVTE